MTADPLSPAPRGASPRGPSRRGHSPRVAVHRVLVEGREQEVALHLAESPLAWLARRKGKDGRALIDPVQALAGERLRADFTRAQLTPRVTTNWSATGGGGGAGPEAFSDAVLAAKCRVDRAVEAVGPELSGVLLDVCCFLKGLESVESERGWPLRTAKVVLALALDRLAAHYGLARATEGHAHVRGRTWRAEPDAPD
ncbi:DUF6456 domain-containing protein [Roseixanthobacter liquoris]|uniref:DUF6456 domain-containing protein n=1 Tax=Roseixanthobacter liquoris TaxID=3119921 RepID=UPI0037280CDA